MGKPVFFQNIIFFPFEEIKAIVSHFPEKFIHLNCRDFACQAVGMNSDPVQNLVFDDIANSCKYVLT